MFHVKGLLCVCRFVYYVNEQCRHPFCILKIMLRRHNYSTSLRLVNYAFVPLWLVVLRCHDNYALIKYVNE